MWQFGVEGMTSVVTDLVQHAECSNLATMLKVVLYRTVAKGVAKALHPCDHTINLDLMCRST